MKKESLNIPPYISTRVYLIGTPDSRAYISNEKTHEFLLLEAEAADLWNLILNFKNIQEVYEYAKIRNIEEELDHFLNELVDLDLISFNDIDNKIEYAVMNATPKEDIEAVKFIENMNDWLINKNFLPGLFIELTYKCNLNCIHCYNPKNIPEKEIRFKNIKSIVDDAVELGVFKIILSGGECTLVKDFLDIAKYVRKKRISLELFTNGQTLYDKPELLNEIIKLYPYRIALSLYSMNPDIHDEITGVKGSHNKTLSVIKKLKKNNVNVEIKCFVQDKNVSSYKEVVQFAKDIGVSYGVDSTFLDNKENNNAHVQLTDKQLFDLYTDTDSDFCIQNKSIVIDNKFLNNIPCKGGHHFFSINSLLEVYPCCCFDVSFGNLNNKSLIDIYRNENPNSNLQQWKRIKVNDLKDCFKDDYCKYCYYCAGKATKENCYLGKSEVLCRIAKIKMKASAN